MKRIKKLSTWRRIALVAWPPPKNPSVYGFMEIDFEKSMAYLDHYKEKFQSKITVTHLVTKALAKALKKNPSVNACIRWNRLYEREQVDIFLQVAGEDGKELSGAKIENVNEKSLLTIASELRDKSMKIRTNQDPQFKKTKGLLKWMPLFLIKILLKVTDFLGNTLLLNLPSLGIPKDPFGSAMITSVGMLGIDVGFAPFTTFARTPLIVMVGKVALRPAVVDGKVVPRKTILLSATFDHRVVDGFQIGKLIRDIRDILENPSDEIYHSTLPEDSLLEGKSS